MTLARDERAALVATFREVGPDAPTLCTGWTTRDLAAHLVVRERRLDAAPGIVVPALAGYTKTVQERAATQEWDVLVGKVADGPPIWSPYRVVDAVANLPEMFVHHEDVLRGAADPTATWTPRTLAADLQKALRAPVKMVGRLTLRESPARVTLRTRDGEDLVTAGEGAPVTVTGTPGELLLFAFGRTPVDVAVDGDPDAVAAVRAADRGL